jgi:F0F1-type ATP synthase membrane subunit b/b'
MIYWVQVDVSPIIKSWGAWGAVSVALGFFFWKWVLPRIDEWLKQRRDERTTERDERRKRDERFVQMISDNLEAERAESKAERDKFLGLVEGTLKGQTDAMTTLIKKVDESLHR